MLPTSPSALKLMDIGFSATVLAALTFAAPRAVSAQQPRGPAPDSVVYQVDPLVVTATRGPRAVSDIPLPVSVIQARDLTEQMPNTISDVFRDLPGLDVTGVGVSQVRPQIRGESGQRILLLNDGLRMNNTRRKSDFGELPAVVDVGDIDHVEVVRGPASVLYGSDAIGGVVNLITKVPTQQGFTGSGSYLFGSAGQQSRASARVQGRSGALSVVAGGSWRTVDAYKAPSGSFGDITLSDEVTVNHSGVEDQNFDSRFGWDFNSSVSGFAKVEVYRSDDSGFAYVDPASYSPGYPTVDITYPKQRFTKLTAGLTARGLDSPLADQFEVRAYGQDNERNQVFDFFIPFGPGSGLSLIDRGFTDIRTYGFRGEARKLATEGLVITYGVDGFQDGSVGTNESTTTFIGGGPPPSSTNAPTIPDADLLSLGTFLQGEVDVGQRLSVVAGGRFQHVSTETFATPNLSNTPVSKSNSALVGAFNVMYEVADGLDLVASTGRGFRSPNLVDLFFDGAVVEDNVYLRAAERLKAETSFNVDLGARYQMDGLFVEGFVFRNKVSNGIRSRVVLEAGGDPVQTQGFDTYETVNVDEIVLRGFEANGDYRLAGGVELGASVSVLDAKDAIDPDNPIGESYSRKLTGRVGYRDAAGRFWALWQIRHSGTQKDAALDSTDPVGTELPPFTVMGVRGSVRLPVVGGFTNSLTVAVSNLTDELYAETANAAFFRPEPKRSLTVAWNVTF